MSDRSVELILENGQSIFYDVQDKTKILIPESVNDSRVVALSDHAFQRKTQVETIQLPKTLVNIGDSAFEGCSRLTSIQLGRVKRIGRHAFKDCVSLQTIKLPMMCTDWGEGVFKGSGLNRIKLPSALLEISESAFESCTKLQSVVFPSNLKIIRAASFKDCKNLRLAFLPPKLNRIYPKAFYGSGLETLIIPNSVKYLEASTWGDCRSLRRLVLPEGMAHLNRNEHLANFPALRIPDEIRDLRAYDFSSNAYLKVVELPRNLKAIHMMTFRHHELEVIQFDTHIAHFDKILLSALFIKDFVVREEISSLIMNKTEKGVRIETTPSDVRSLVAKNRHVELRLLATQKPIRRHIVRHLESLLRLANETSAMQSKIVLMDVVSERTAQTFEL